MALNFFKYEEVLIFIQTQRRIKPRSYDDEKLIDDIFKKGINSLNKPELKELSNELVQFKVLHHIYNNTFLDQLIIDLINISKNV